MGVVKKWVDVPDKIDLKIKQLTTNQSIIQGKRVLESEVILKLIEKGLQHTPLHIKRN